MKKNIYVIIACVIKLLLIAIRLLAAPYRLFGYCMEPVFKNGKLYFLNSLAPYLRNYKINDVVAFNYEDKAWIARIVALENSTLQLSEGKIEENGIAQQDPGIKRSWVGWDYGIYAIGKPCQVPSGHVFVLSDNLSAQHDDSRFFGPISQASILGLLW